MKVIASYRAVGLPTRLARLDVAEATREKIRAVAKACCIEGETIHNMPFPVTEENVCAAVRIADKLGGGE